MLMLGEPVEAAVASALEVLPADMAEVYVPLLSAEWVPGDDAPNNGSAMGALAQAVWALRAGGSFAEVVTSAIDLGGDTDTVAAIAGALAGARWGIQAIPSRWVTYLHGFVQGTDGVRRRYDHLALQRMASALAGWPSGHGSDDEPALPAAEVLLTSVDGTVSAGQGAPVPRSAYVGRNHSGNADEDAKIAGLRRTS